MEKKLHENISYSLKRSRRAKWLRIAVENNGNVVITAPYRINVSVIDEFILEKANWIKSKILLFQKNATAIAADDFKCSKSRAANFIKNRLDYFNDSYGFNYNRICIKNHRRKWGSCSIRRNLNFNYRILFLPEALADYVVVHELCHLKEMNHSKRFWHLVALKIPDHRERRRQLRNVVFNK